MEDQENEKDNNKPRPKSVYIKKKNSYSTYKISDLFPFKIYNVGYDGETLKEVADKIGVEEKELRYLNDIPDDVQKLEPLRVRPILF